MLDIGVHFRFCGGPYSMNVGVVVDLQINNSGQAVTMHAMKKVCTNQGCLVAQV